MNAPALAVHAPGTLDHAGIAARVPHSGAMCLLDRLLRWDADELECGIINHVDGAHPLRAPIEVVGNAHGKVTTMLPAASAIEYAAQAMALHAALKAAAGARPSRGFLASAREVHLFVDRLDTAPGPLRVLARRLAGDERQAIYRFALHDAPGRVLVEGRATVVLDGPLRPHSLP
jgi:predicted hotdog family 3-hydroxylacyl-ACP dehydratase